MLIVYVTLIIVVENLGDKQIIDVETVKTFFFSLDLPTMLVLVVFAGLSCRQELTKPKYNIPKKYHKSIDASMVLIGIALMAVLLTIKYLM